MKRGHYVWNVRRALKHLAAIDKSASGIVDRYLAFEI